MVKSKATTQFNDIGYDAFGMVDKHYVPNRDHKRKSPLQGELLSMASLAAAYQASPAKLKEAAEFVNGCNSWCFPGLGVEKVITGEADGAPKAPSPEKESARLRRIATRDNFGSVIYSQRC